MKPEEYLKKLEIIKMDLQRALGNIEYLRRETELAIKLLKQEEEVK